MLIINTDEEEKDIRASKTVTVLVTVTVAPPLAFPLLYPYDEVEGELFPWVYVLYELGSEA